MRESYLSSRVAGLKPSGIRRFFDIAATMKDVISLGIGEPDFNSPPAVVAAGIRALEEGHSHYTSNAGILELRQALAGNFAVQRSGSGTAAIRWFELRKEGARLVGRTAELAAVRLATAIGHGLALVTLNQAHFEAIGGLSLYPVVGEG